MRPQLLIAQCWLTEKQGQWQLGLRLLSVAIRIAIGGTFFMSGLLKVVNRDEFINALMSYEILSSRMILIASYVVPQAEMLLGALLAFGLSTRIVSWTLAAQVMIFSSVGAIAFAQGNMVDCGCFPVAGARELIGAGYFLRNGALILACAWIGLMSFTKERSLQIQN